MALVYVKVYNSGIGCLLWHEATPNATIIDIPDQYYWQRTYNKAIMKTSFPKKVEQLHKGNTICDYA